jgi:hypothetical protein
MKAFIITLVLACFANIAQAGPTRLLLIPVETSLKPRADVQFDLYLWNNSARPTKVPSLKLLSTTYVLRDISGKRLPRFKSSTQSASHPLSEHLLQPNTAERTRIRIDIPAERGDLVEVYAEISGSSALRSNVVLLFCPGAKSTQPASSPKSAITPQKN